MDPDTESPSNLTPKPSSNLKHANFKGKISSPNAISNSRKSGLYNPNEVHSHASNPSSSSSSKSILTGKKAIIISNNMARNSHFSSSIPSPSRIQPPTSSAKRISAQPKQTSLVEKRLGSEKTLIPEVTRTGKSSEIPPVATNSYHSPTAELPDLSDDTPPNLRTMNVRLTSSIPSKQEQKINSLGSRKGWNSGKNVDSNKKGNFSTVSSRTEANIDTRSKATYSVSNKVESEIDSKRSKHSQGSYSFSALSSSSPSSANPSIFSKPKLSQEPSSYGYSNSISPTFQHNQSKSIQEKSENLSPPFPVTEPKILQNLTTNSSQLASMLPVNNSPDDEKITTSNSFHNQDNNFPQMHESRNEETIEKSMSLVSSNNSTSTVPIKDFVSPKEGKIKVERIEIDSENVIRLRKKKSRSSLDHKNEDSFSENYSQNNISSISSPEQFSNIVYQKRSKRIGKGKTKKSSDNRNLNTSSEESTSWNNMDSSEQDTEETRREKEGEVCSSMMDIEEGALADIESDYSREKSTLKGFKMHNWNEVSKLRNEIVNEGEREGDEDDDVAWKDDDDAKKGDGASNTSSAVTPLEMEPVRNGDDSNCTGDKGNDDGSGGGNGRINHSAKNLKLCATVVDICIGNNVNGRTHLASNPINNAEKFGRDFNSMPNVHDGNADDNASNVELVGSEECIPANDFIIALDCTTKIDTSLHPVKENCTNVPNNGDAQKSVEHVNVDDDCGKDEVASESRNLNNESTFVHGMKVSNVNKADSAKHHADSLLHAASPNPASEVLKETKMGRDSIRAVNPSFSENRGKLNADSEEKVKQKERMGSEEINKEKEKKKEKQLLPLGKTRKKSNDYNENFKLWLDENQLYGDLVGQVKAQIEGWKREDFSMDQQNFTKLQHMTMSNGKISFSETPSDFSTNSRNTLIQNHDSILNNKEPSILFPNYSPLSGINACDAMHFQNHSDSLTLLSIAKQASTSEIVSSFSSSVKTKQHCYSISKSLPSPSMPCCIPSSSSCTSFYSSLPSSVSSLSSSSSHSFGSTTASIASSTIGTLSDTSMHNSIARKNAYSLTKETMGGTKLYPCSLKSMSSDVFEWDKCSSLDETYSDISTPSTMLSRNMTIEEATEIVLFCSSIVHDLIYKAAIVAETKPTCPPDAAHHPSFASISSSSKLLKHSESSFSAISEKSEVVEVMDNIIHVAAGGNDKEDNYPIENPKSGIESKTFCEKDLQGSKGVPACGCVIL